jgi:hypothetical protein
MTVDVKCVRTSDAPDLVRSLAEQGFQADIVAAEGHIAVSADDLPGVEHALERWAAERGLPFVPHLVDERHVVLCPPGS